MLRILFLVALLAGASLMALPSDQKPERKGKDGPPSGYDLVLSFSDEFDRNAVNSKNWEPISAPSYGKDRTIARRTLWNNAEQQVYFDPDYLSLGIQPVHVKDGVLTITAQPMTEQTRAAVMRQVAAMPPQISSIAALKSLKYQSGLIAGRGHFAQKYGYFEVRARWSKGRGLWPAIWLLPDDGGWPPEIDIMESLGHDSSTVYHSTHSKFTPKSTAVKNSFGGNTQEFHSYGMLWTPGLTEYFIDGKKMATISTSPDMTKPMFVIVNLAVGGNWPGYPDAATAFPATMDVDYVRIWKFKTLPKAEKATSPRSGG
jgi:beta-glucanase (GH16 family)